MSTTIPKSRVARLLAAAAPLVALVHDDGVEAPYPEEWWSPVLTALADATVEVPDEQTAAQFLYAALCDLQHEPGCWCDMANGNPMYRDHSPACKQAQLAQRAYSGFIE
jgi:hypothetical protein